MSFNRHGRIGANIYILILLLVTITPELRILKALEIVYFLATACLVLLGAWINTKAILQYGGSTKGTQ
jgi:hypothetical protein